MSPADKRRSPHLIGPLFQSYGGFVTAHALGDEHSKVFKCGISVAPVTDFRYYGSHFELFVYLLFKFESIVISDEVHVLSLPKCTSLLQILLIQSDI